MSRIVIHSVGSLGDLNPLRRVGRALASRGHEVVFLTLSDYAEALRGDGIQHESIPFQVSSKDAELAHQILESKTGGKYLFRELVLKHLRETYRTLERVSHGADLLLSGSLAFSCALLHETKRIPWVSVTLQPYLYFSETDFPVIAQFPHLRFLTRRFPTVARGFKHFMRREIDSWSREEPAGWAELLKEIGVSSNKNIIFDCSSSPLLDLAVFSPLLGSPQKDWPSSTRVVGFIQEPLASSPFSPATERFLAQGEKPIVFTLGSAAVLNGREFFVQAMRYVERTGGRALIVCGDWASELSQHNPAPSRIHVVGPEPYHSLFVRARAVVHQGGVGTTGEALRAGVPQLVVPVGQDQYDQGERVRRLGCGAWVPMDKVMRRGSLELPDFEPFRTRAHEVGQEIQQENGLKKSLELIEALI